MKKINLISKTFTIFLFSSILAFSSFYNKEKPINGRIPEIPEINLRNLEDFKFIFIINIICSACFASYLFVILFEICEHYCCNNCICGCQCEHELPNRCTFLYYCLNGLIIILIIHYFIFKQTEELYTLFALSGAFVIYSIIYHVKYCHNPKQYCNEICTMEYLRALAAYPYPLYCFCILVCDEKTCDFRNCESCTKEIVGRILLIPCFAIYAFIYVIGSAIEYYLFLFVYMLLMLLTKIFTCELSCDSDSDSDCKCCSCCCECCHCCKCCSKKNKVNIPNNEPNDVPITTLRAEAFYFESFRVNETVVSKNDNENNNEIEEEENPHENNNEVEEENVYENNNDNNIIISTNILCIASNTQ